MSTYRAAVCTELGKPIQILQQQEKPLNNDEVRVSVAYSGVNFADALQVVGRYQVKAQIPFLLGMECSGRVIEVGPSVTDLHSGDHVIGCIINTDGEFGRGSHAEQVVTRQFFLKVDKNLPLAEGASLLGSYATAYITLFHRAHIQKHDVVMVTAAAGALGLATVDLAANVIGAKVIGVCGGPDKCQLVRSYGAAEVIDYNQENLRKRVKEITSGRGVAIAVDSVGGKILEDCLHCMAFEGQLFTLGYSSGDIPKLASNLLLLKNISVHGFFMGNYTTAKPHVFYDAVHQLVKLWTERKIKPHVGKIFPLAQINEAFEFIKSRQSVGKVVLDCSQHSVL